MAKRKRRAFTKEFKAQAVRIVRQSGKAVGTVARELDLTETALRSWVRQAEIDAGRGAPGAPRPASISACRTQLRNAVSVRSSSRATVPTAFPLSRTIRTACALGRFNRP